LRQLAEDARATFAKIVRRLVWKVIEITLSDIDLAAVSEIRTALRHLRKNICAMFPSSAAALTCSLMR
jgi:hypothetical protein